MESNDPVNANEHEDDWVEYPEAPSTNTDSTGTEPPPFQAETSTGSEHSSPPESTATGPAVTPLAVLDALMRQMAIALLAELGRHSGQEALHERSTTAEDAEPEASSDLTPKRTNPSSEASLDHNITSSEEVLAQELPGDSPNADLESPPFDPSWMRIYPLHGELPDIETARAAAAWVNGDQSGSGSGGVGIGVEISVANVDAIARVALSNSKEEIADLIDAALYEVNRDFFSLRASIQACLR